MIPLTLLDHSDPGSPKGAPRVPQEPPRPHFGDPGSPQGHPRHHFGAPGSPSEPPRLTKRHPKSSILSLFGPLGTLRARASILSTLHFKNCIQGLIFIDVYNVTGCFHDFCCQRCSPDSVYLPRPSSPMQAETTGGLSSVVPPLRRGKPLPPGTTKV